MIVITTNISTSVNPRSRLLARTALLGLALQVFLCVP